MFSIKYKKLLLAIGFLLSSIVWLIIFIYSRPIDFFDLNASILCFSIGIYILSINRKDYYNNYKPIIKSKFIIYVLLTFLIVLDSVLFYIFFFNTPVILNNYKAIDNAIIGQLSLTTLCWIGIVINLKYKK